MFKLRSSNPSAPFGGSRTCALSTMEVAPAVDGVTDALARVTEPCFGIAQSYEVKVLIFDN